jgi:galactokinase
MSAVDNRSHSRVFLHLLLFRIRAISMTDNIVHPKRADLFVPGRVCLLGEHTDWAGGFRRDEFAEAIHPGQCLAYGTNVGIHALATRVDGLHGHPMLQFVGNALPPMVEPLCVQLDPPVLRARAAEGGFYSYVCGTAALMTERIGLDRIGSHTILIDNYNTTMPMKKGLSSSAAVCVLVARAFAQLFDHHLTVEEEMDIAYRGERLTPSRCGRMDQCCAFGPKFVSMVFEGDRVTSTELICPQPVHFVVADLNASKDTKVILARLTEAYPDARGAVHEGVRRFLGSVSWSITEQAKEAIAHGDAQKLGEIFDEAQRQFDHYLMPACPEQLSSPRLHSILFDPTVRLHVYGGKGVGSQGDGSVQFVCRDAASQQAALEALFHLGCHPFALTVGMPAATPPSR